jgi:broad specificity phosphatase PhoE
MRLYVVRHGQSQTNLEKRWTGWLDAPLTEAGERDALFARGVLSGIEFDAVYSSDLSRAVRTAELVLPSAEFETTELLREVNVGDIAGKPLSVMTSAMRAQVKAEGYSALGGESREELRCRVEKFLALCTAKDHETIAVFTHNGWVLSMLELVLGAPIAGMGTILVSNCAVVIIENINGNWRLCGLINKDTVHPSQELY